jgi:hypothetical protein
MACGQCILPRFAARSCNEETAGKRVTGTRAVDAHWEWMCRERRNLLATRRAHLGDPCPVFCNQDGARERAIREVEVVTLLLIGEQECWGELRKAAAALLWSPGTQRTNRRGIKRRRDPCVAGVSEEATCGLPKWLAE